MYWRHIGFTLWLFSRYWMIYFFKSLIFYKKSFFVYYFLLYYVVVNLFTHSTFWPLIIYNISFQLFSSFNVILFLEIIDSSNILPWSSPDPKYFFKTKFCLIKIPHEIIRMLVCLPFKIYKGIRVLLFHSNIRLTFSFFLFI